MVKRAQHMQLLIQYKTASAAGEASVLPAKEVCRTNKNVNNIKFYPSQITAHRARVLLSVDVQTTRLFNSHVVYMGGIRTHSDQCLLIGCRLMQSSF